MKLHCLIKLVTIAKALNHNATAPNHNAFKNIANAIRQALNADNYADARIAKMTKTQYDKEVSKKKRRTNA